MTFSKGRDELIDLLRVNNGQRITKRTEAHYFPLWALVSKKGMNLCKECNISFMKWPSKSFGLKVFFVWKSC